MNDELIVEYGIYLIVIGLVLVLLLCLLLFLRRRSQSKKGLRPAAAAVVDEIEAMPEPPALSDAAESQSEAIEETGGFKIFKKNDKQKKAGQSDDTLSQLQSIEQEMLALRELFRNGEITRSVYIAETKALYDKAQQIKTI